MLIQLSVSLHFYLVCSLLNSYDGNDALTSLCARETVQLLQQETPDFISPGLCPPNSPVDPETRLTTEFGDWCRNVCTLYKTPVRDYLMQRISFLKVLSRCLPKIIKIRPCLSKLALAKNLAHFLRHSVAYVYISYRFWDIQRPIIAWLWNFG